MCVVLDFSSGEDALTDLYAHRAVHSSLRASVFLFGVIICLVLGMFGDLPFVLMCSGDDAAEAHNCLRAQTSRLGTWGKGGGLCLVVCSFPAPPCHPLYGRGAARSFCDLFFSCQGPWYCEASPRSVCCALWESGQASGRPCTREGVCSFSAPHHRGKHLAVECARAATPLCMALSA